MNKLLFSIIFLISSISTAKMIQPKSVSDLYKTSVRIYNTEMSSGGTGSIFRSYANASHILTNKHVCRIIEQGGLVHHRDDMYKISHYKKFEQHDLCLVRIKKGLDVSTEVADSIAKKSSTIYVSGHPNLLPHIVTKGHLSDRIDVNLVIGTRECGDDISSIDCAWFGGEPVVKTFDSQLVSNLIKPGSSGSAVFNEDGKIVGVIYAGDGREFSYGYIVPQIYILFFVQNAHRYEWTKVGTPVPDKGMSDRVFNYNRCRDVRIKDNKKYDSIKKFCRSIKDNTIWRKL